MIDVNLGITVLKSALGFLASCIAHNKIDDFKSSADAIDEMFENREQIEIVRRFERQPKPTLEATEEYLEGQIYYRNPAKEDKQAQHFESLEEQIINA